MPLYEYECNTCGRRFERIQKFSDPPASTCPTCGGPVRKLFSSPAIQFKGSGFYITDYARSGSEGGAKGEKGGEGDSSKAGEQKSGEDKAGEKKADTAATSSTTESSGSTGAKAEPAKPSTGSTSKE